jgi:hypothetical protein
LGGPASIARRASAAFRPAAGKIAVNAVGVDLLVTLDGDGNLARIVVT